MGRVVEFVGRTLGVAIDGDTEILPSWTPTIEGRLKKIIVVPGGIAATTLIENGYIKLTSPTFNGVDMYAPFDGGGLRTAPVAKGYWKCETECDLEVKRTPVKLFYYHNVLPVTPEISIFAEIEA